MVDKKPAVGTVEQSYGYPRQHCFFELPDGIAHRVRGVVADGLALNADQRSGGASEVTHLEASPCPRRGSYSVVS